MFNILSRPKVDPSSIPPWLAEARRRVPAVKALLEVARQTWSKVIDPRCSPWATAAALVGLIESVPIVVTGTPVVIVRLVILFGFLSQRDRAGGAHPHQVESWRRRRRRHRHHLPARRDRDERGWSWWF